jgi:hypothetical protein
MLLEVTQKVRPSSIYQRSDGSLTNN